MQLRQFHIEGFRSLADIGPIHLGALAVLVGPNDAGKTACLNALDFLLNGTPLAEEDRTLTDTDGDVESGGMQARVSATIVTAVFDISAYEQRELSLSASIELRRRADADEAAQYEVKQRVCADETLRDIESMDRNKLRTLATERQLATEGNRNAKQTYLAPLQVLRDSLPQIEEWVLAPRALTARLPQYLAFSSSAQPDPEAQMRAALQAAYNQILQQSAIRGSIDQIESTVSEGLAKEANELCAHIKTHCPELESVTADPEVSFRSGFSKVTLRTSRANNEEIDLKRSGAGKQQRVTLAIWEWTSKLVGNEDDESALETVLVYDEPDTHLDYERQRGFLDLMQKQAAKPGVQVILATHSLNLLDRVNMADLVSLRTVDNRTTIDAVIDQSHESLDMFTSDLVQSLGLRNSVLLNEKCFLVVEGETERICLPILFRLHHGLPLQSVGIALMACGGNEGALKVAKFLIEQRRELFFLLDQDSATHPATRKLFSPEKLTAAGIPEANRLYVGSPNELEELFTNEQWCAVANAKWPRNDGVEWAESDIESVRLAGKFSSLALDQFKKMSDTGPLSKPEMLSKLVGTLREPEEVPDQLRDKFDTIMDAIAI